MGRETERHLKKNYGPEIARRYRKRSCGGCRACCTVKAVDETTPSWTPCEHECEKGCAIYQSRPKDCEDYICLWRAGFLEKQHRPDRCGILTDHNTKGDAGFWMRPVDPEDSCKDQALDILHILRTNSPDSPVYWVDWKSDTRSIVHIPREFLK